MSYRKETGVRGSTGGEVKFQKEVNSWVEEVEKKKKRGGEKNLLKQVRMGSPNRLAKNARKRSR